MTSNQIIPVGTFRVAWWLGGLVADPLPLKFWSEKMLALRSSSWENHGNMQEKTSINGGS